MKVTEDTTLGEVSEFMKRAKFSHRVMPLGNGFIVIVRDRETRDYLGYGETLAQGLQSALDRRLEEGPSIEDMIAQSSREEAAADERAIAHHNSMLRNANAPDPEKH